MCKYEFGNYKWQGRVDSKTDISAFRWHQIIKQINIDEIDELENPSIVLIGFCSDEGVKRNKGRQGAKEAPLYIRKYLSSLPYHFDKLKMYDAGDIIVNNELEKGQQLLGEKIKKIKSLGGFPIVIGGGHETAYGSFTGIKSFKPSIINFDAHFDNRPFDEITSSGTMFAQIAEELSKDYKYLCLGIQKSGNTKQLFDRNKKFGGIFVTAEDIYSNSINLHNTYRKFVNDSESIYITLCMDVFASSVAPGVSAPTPFGIMPHHFLQIIDEIFKTKNICLFDITEVNPKADINDLTSRLAANIIFHVVDNVNNRGYK